MAEPGAAILACSMGEVCVMSGVDVVKELFTLLASQECDAHNAL